MKLAVPYYSQIKSIKSKNYQLGGCGVTSLKMILDFYNIKNLSLDELYEKGIEIGAYKEDEGWYHHGLVNLAHLFGATGIIRSWNLRVDAKERLNERGFTEKEAEILKDQFYQEGIFTIKDHLDQNIPAIISIPKNFEENGSGHLMTLIGYDDKGFIFNDPWDKERDGKGVKLTYREFKKVWTKRAIFIYPK